MLLREQPDRLKVFPDCLSDIAAVRDNVCTFKLWNFVGELDWLERKPYSCRVRQIVARQLMVLSWLKRLLVYRRHWWRRHSFHLCHCCYAAQNHGLRRLKIRIEVRCLNTVLLYHTWNMQETWSFRMAVELNCMPTENESRWPIVNVVNRDLSLSQQTGQCRFGKITGLGSTRPFAHPKRGLETMNDRAACCIPWWSFVHYLFLTVP